MKHTTLIVFELLPVLCFDIHAPKGITEKELHYIFHDCRNVLPNTGYKFAWQIPMFCQIVM